MPSEGDLTQAALAAFRRPADDFDSVLAAAVGEVRAFLDSHRAPAGDPSERVAHELGAFAGTRIDASRFSGLLDEPETLEAATLDQVQQALDALVHLKQRGSSLIRIDVPSGGDLREEIRKALTRIGRAFAAIRTVSRVRDGRGPEVPDDALRTGLDPRTWRAGERAKAPPLIVEVDGADLRIGGLADYLDGGQKFVLIVRGTAPPAPLARLLTPGVLVVQTRDPQELARVAAFQGPAVAALVPDGCALFHHDPAAGGRYQDRLRVEHLPDPEDVRAVGSLSRFHQTEELALLRALAEAPRIPSAVADTLATGAASLSGMATSAGARPAPAEAPAAVGAPADDPAGRLAGWLLQQTDLSGL